MKYSALLSLSLLLSGCASQTGVTSWLDPASSATITAQTQPIVLTRIAVSKKVSDRDTAKLIALEVNRMGERKLYLAAFLRTTADMDPRWMERLLANFENLSIQLDDRTLKFQRYTGDVGALGITQSSLPLGIVGTKPSYYAVTVEELQALARSTKIELTGFGAPDKPDRYEEWMDGRPSLAAFLSELPERATSPAVASQPPQVPATGGGL